MSRFKISNIIYMTLYDKAHNPLYVNNNAEDITLEGEIRFDYIAREPKVGDRLYLSATINGNMILEIDGFYGGLDA